MDSRAVALLETALRPNANEGERENALSLFRRLADRAGGIEKMVKSSNLPVAPERPAYVPYVAQKSELERLRGTLKERDHRIELLENDVARLTREMAALKKRNQTLTDANQKSIKTLDDGTMAYPEWSSAVISRLASAHNWQHGFCVQTGLSKSKIQFFRNRGTVDADYVEAISTLTAYIPPTRHKLGWTLHQVRRLRELLDAGKTETQSAKILSEEFGRVITDNMIKRIKLDSRDKKGIFTNPAFGPEIGKRRK